MGVDEIASAPVLEDAAPAEPAGAGADGGAAPDAAAESPGTTDRRAMSARTALSHLISSSSLGAQSNSVRFVVTILNVCLPAAPSCSSPPWDGCGGEIACEPGLCRPDGRSYSRASRICARGMERCGLVSCSAGRGVCHTEHSRGSWKRRKGVRTSGTINSIGTSEARTHHVATRVHQPVSAQHEPAVVPVVPSRAAFHKIT